LPFVNSELFFKDGFKIFNDLYAIGFYLRLLFFYMNIFSALFLYFEIFGVSKRIIDATIFLFCSSRYADVSS